MLVNNAGFGLPLAFEQNDIELEVRHLALHVEVPMRLTHAVLEPMLRRGSGRIINVASVAGFIPRATYGACKGWLISFSRWANGRYAPQGVSVTAVCPGFTHTSFHERMGLAQGNEGVPDWMWLDATSVVAESLWARGIAGADLPGAGPVTVQPPGGTVSPQSSAGRGQSRLTCHICGHGPQPSDY